MSIRATILGLMLGHLTLITACGSSQESFGPAVPPPNGLIRNVVLITADDLGLQLNSYGEDRIFTPRINELVSQSIMYPEAWVTQASCSSSRSSLMTGLYPHVNGQIGLANHGFEVDQQYHDRFLPNILRQSGYRTGIIGKLHVNPEHLFQFDFKVNRGAPQKVRTVASDTREFLRRTGTQPFFLMVSFFDPHAVIDPETGKLGFPTQIDGLPENPISSSAETIFAEQGIDTPEQRERTTGYLNSVMRLDHGLGLVLDALEETGHAEDTLVIFIGDHGPPFVRGKTTTYEFGLRIPFLIRWPGMTSGQVGESMVNSIDIYPTILEALGITAPDKLDGMSLLPSVQDPSKNLRDVMFAEWNYHDVDNYFPRRTVRDKRFHLIHNLQAGHSEPLRHIDGDRIYYTAISDTYKDTIPGKAFEIFGNPPEFELYDLEQDPSEFHNLATVEEFQAELERLKRELDNWRNQTGDISP